MTFDRYPEHVRDALVIDHSWSYCGRCGRGARPSEKTHATLAGYGNDKGPGCGFRWTKVTTAYAGPEMERAVRDLRPDLEFVEMWPSLGQHG